MTTTPATPPPHPSPSSPALCCLKWAPMAPLAGGASPVITDAQQDAIRAPHVMKVQQILHHLHLEQYFDALIDNGPTLFLPVSRVWIHVAIRSTPPVIFYFLFPIYALIWFHKIFQIVITNSPKRNSPIFYFHCCAPLIFNHGRLDVCKGACPSAGYDDVRSLYCLTEGDLVSMSFETRHAQRFLKWVRANSAAMISPALPPPHGV